MPRLEPAPPARSRKVPPVRPQPIPDDDAVLSDHAIRAIERGARTTPPSARSPWRR